MPEPDLEKNSDNVVGTLRLPSPNGTRSVPTTLSGGLRRSARHFAFMHFVSRLRRGQFGIERIPTSEEGMNKPFQAAGRF